MAKTVFAVCHSSRVDAAYAELGRNGNDELLSVLLESVHEALFGAGIRFG